ncbi:tyrosine-type recombinase/integrase [Janthinobacterium sp. ROICE36]|uniref:tyrosine-type recombinase/integrase n=1 Tax=Janthinobacterium sp. ROICE36 TaxID=2048670 RepID=UPI002155B73C|nr:site-specific integrase [Janthinobacterium sp. ROICE36]
MFAALIEVKSLVLDAILARVPGGKGRNGLGKRTSLTQEAQERVWQVIGPESPENPWKGAHARARNELIVRWLLGLGVRRGELLGVDIRLINFRSNEVVVVRRADDKHDPRGIQPNAKTLDRVLPFNGDLAKRTQDYIINFRRKFPLAKKHPFLFVANGGRPLGIRALNKIFEALRERCPDLPDDVMPHVLRHTWNDNFSIAMDDSGTAPENEQKMRSRLMGWKPTSKTAETYNRRATERRARKASLEMQEKMVKRTK